MNARPKVQIRPPANAGAFVEKGDDRPVRLATSRSVNQSTKQPKKGAAASGRGIVSRVRKGDLDRITAYLPVELGAQLRMHCASRRLEMSEAIAEALRPWLAKNAPS